VLCTQDLEAVVIGGSVTGGSAATAGGVFIELTPPLSNPFGPPNSVGNNTFQNPNLYAFDEDQNVLVGPANLSVDQIPGGGPGTIPAGTEVASHYVFFDPGPVQSQLGYVDFDADILAVITGTANLAASDYLANTGINYLNPAARGLEAGDSAPIDLLLPYRLNVDWDASTPGDYVRVLTRHSPGATVPDTGSSRMLIAFGLVALAGVRRFRL
jgi:hypothetical protein